jgi:hypothetical protein
MVPCTFNMHRVLQADSSSCDSYIPAKITIVAVNASAIVVSTALRVLYGMRNARADRRGQGRDARGTIEARFMKEGDVVDGNREFRYVY